MPPRNNSKTGAITLDTENPGDVIGWTTDHNFVIRAATVFRPADQSTVLRVAMPQINHGEI